MKTIIRLDDSGRFITQLSKASDESELSFSDEKLRHNFSNYSAWHYRSRLLARIHPDKSEQIVTSAETMTKELDLVKNALFTDPNDQSAWFYTLWLLQTPVQDDNSSMNSVLTATIYSIDDNTKGCVCFRAPVEMDQLSNEITVNGANVHVVWKPFPNEAVSSRVWTISHSGLPIYSMAYTGLMLNNQDVSFTVQEENKIFVDMKLIRQELCIHTENMSQPLADVTRDLLNTANELIEMEPDSTWPHLISVMCMTKLDAVKHKPIITDRLSKLQNLDKQRACYYQDLQSLINLSVALCDGSTWEQGSLDLRGLDLTSLPLTHLLSTVSSIDLSDNKLTSIKAISSAVSLQHFTANENELTSLEGLENLERLVFVSVAANRFTDPKQFEAISGKPLTSFVYA